LSGIVYHLHFPHTHLKINLDVIAKLELPWFE
jgi:hypothetical protein